MLQSITEYYRVLQSVAKCYRVLQSVTVLQSETESYRVLKSISEYYRVLQSITEYYRVLQTITNYYRVVQSITSTNLAHLLGPIFGLVFKHLPLGVRMETVLIFFHFLFWKTSLRQPFLSIVYLFIVDEMSNMFFSCPGQLNR